MLKKIIKIQNNNNDNNNKSKIKNRKADAILKLEPHDLISCIDDLTSQFIFTEDKRKSRHKW